MKSLRLSGVLVAIALVAVVAMNALVLLSSPWNREIRVQLVADEPSDERPGGTLAVVGDATIEVVPDLADVRITLRVQAKSPEAVHRALSEQKRALVAGVKQAAGIAEEEISATLDQLAPEYRYVGEQRRLSHYQGSLAIAITTGDFQLIDKLAKAATTAEAQNVSVKFRSTKLEELKSKVRQMALDNAKEKAEQMVSSVGSKIKRVTTISETSSGAGWRYNAAPTKSIAVGQGEAVVRASRQPLTLAVTINYELD